MQVYMLYMHLVAISCALVVFQSKRIVNGNRINEHFQLFKEINFLRRSKVKKTLKINYRCFYRIKYFNFNGSLVGFFFFCWPCSLAFVFPTFFNYGEN